MNWKQFTLLLIVVVVLGAAGLMVYQRNASSWGRSSQAMGRKLLADLPVNDVAAIVIKSGTNTMTLHRTNDLWCVQERHDYPADFSLIKGFLVKATELKATQNEEAGPTLLARYGLLPPGPATNTGTLVEFKDAAGKTVNSLLIGKTHLSKPARSTPTGEPGSEGFPNGRYVMVGNDAVAANVSSRTVQLISDPLNTAEVKPESWLNKDFFKVEKIRAISVAFPIATNSWQVSRTNETGSDWVLADAQPGEQLDSSKTSSFAYALSSPAFTDVRPADTADPTGLDQPTVITLSTFDNFTYTLKVGAKMNDDYYLTVAVAADLPKERAPGQDEKPEDKTKLDQAFKDSQTKLQEKLTREQAFGKWVYLVSTWTVEPLLKERASLMVEKKEESKAEPAAEPAKDELKKDESAG